MAEGLPVSNRLPRFRPGLSPSKDHRPRRVKFGDTRRCAPAVSALDSRGALRHNYRLNLMCAARPGGNVRMTAARRVEPQGSGLEA